MSGAGSGQATVTGATRLYAIIGAQALGGAPR
jgi:hypothetical protein